MVEAPPLRFMYKVPTGAVTTLSGEPVPRIVDALACWLLGSGSQPPPRAPPRADLSSDVLVRVVGRFAD